MRPDPPFPPEVTDLLRQALERRLREVREVLRSMSGTEPDAGVVSSQPAGGRPRDPGAHAASPPEENLRRLMVGVLPTMRDRPGPGRAPLFALLADLEPASRSRDLRFLDAWNSACEALLAWPREDLDRDDARGALRSYESLLEGHLERLGGRP